MHKGKFCETHIEEATLKRLLKKYGYPPDKTAKAVDIVMEQTKLMCMNT
jgi:hypothetical protein